MIPCLVQIAGIHWKYQRMAHIEKFIWSQLGSVPDQPGIYAWYYSPEITKFDMTKFVEGVKQMSSEGRIAEAQDLIRRFLDKYLFGFFREDPFFAQLSGALKPSYEGELRHRATISPSLVNRLCENPERLRVIREVLELSTPHFASPIYIGMSAEGLRGRIGTHKSLIERLRKRSSANDTTEDDIGDAGDAGFAKRVVKRGIPPERLFVTTCVIDSQDDIHVDIENILNRIYYPILGRN
jgi:hypothetical protein